MLFARVLIASVFLWAVTQKVWNRNAASEEDVTIYSALVSENKAVSYLATAGELTISIWLISGFRQQWAARTVLILLSFFSGIIAAEFTKASPRPCGCLGSMAADKRPTMIRWSLAGSLARNTVLMGAAIYLLTLSKRSPKGAGSFAATAKADSDLCTDPHIEARSHFGKSS
jgi:uncharacterized membrane protein YphA (DoxX/SURF4 family)